MQDPDRKLAWSGVFVLAVIALEVAIALAVIGPEYKEAHSAAARAAEAQGYRDYSMWEYSGTWIAVFTIVLTASTAALWWVTRNTLRHAEKSSEEQMRAYVGVEDIFLEAPHFWQSGWDVPQDTPPDFVYEDLLRVKIRNAGKSPAHNVAVFISWHIVTPFGGYPNGYLFPSDLTPDQLERTSRFILDSDAAFVSSISITKTLKPFREAHQKLISLYFDGWIEYTDIFGKAWERKFRFLWQPWRDGIDSIVPARAGNEEKRSN